MERTEFLKALQKEEQNLVSSISSLTENLKAVQTLIKSYADGNITVSTTIKPQSFKANDSGKTLNQITLEILQEFGEATSRQVGIEILKRYPAYTEERALTIARVRLSALNKEGKIESEKIPNTINFLYKIKKDG